MANLIDIINVDNEPNILQTMPLPKHGGHRKGAGRKPAPYSTIVLSFRVREDWAEEIKALVKSAVDQHQQQSEASPPPER